jgi:hypothetical protein
MTAWITEKELPITVRDTLVKLGVEPSPMKRYTPVKRIFCGFDLDCFPRNRNYLLRRLYGDLSVIAIIKASRSSGNLSSVMTALSERNIIEKAGKNAAGMLRYILYG